LSHNAHLALDPGATQPNLDDHRVASLVRDALQDLSFFLLQSDSRMEATYQALVNSPVGANPMSIANLTSTELTIQTRLNDQSQYDIVSAHLRDLSGVISITLSAPPPASAHGQAFSVLSRQQPSISSHLAAQSSREQLTRARMRQHSSQDFSGAPLPSGASDSTQSMVFSHDGSAGASTGVPGPSRNRSAHAARSAPYQAPSQPSRSGATSEGQPPKRTSATDEQINAHLYNADGSLRTQRDVTIALHVAGLGARDARITAQRQAAGGARQLPGATVEQINAHLHNDDGSLRTRRDVASALHAAGLGADSARITAQMRAARGPQ
jgi:hypothetical protein